MKLLIDTNVLSEIQRPQGNPAVRERLEAAGSANIFVSVITLGEIAYGIERLAAGKKRRELEQWQAGLKQHFADRLLGIDVEITQIWGKLAATSESQGRQLDPADGLIAATALHHGLHVMTRNIKDFEQTGVMLVNPWGN